MDSPPDTFHLDEDAPLADELHDVLDYVPFARTLTQSIAFGKVGAGTVIALQGKWGSGKSTVISFVEQRIAQQDAPVDVVRYRPWWFRGREHVAFGLIAAIEDGHRSTRRWWWRGADLLLRVVLRLTGWIARAFTGVPYASTYAQQALARLGRPKQLEAAHNRLRKQLRKRARRMLVIVDDIDRLNPDEIEQVFSVMKGMVVFPNVTYLLAYDPDVVHHALDEKLGNGFGRPYLEKIAQVTFDMPIPGQPALQSMFETRVRPLSELEGALPLARRRWDDAFQYGIGPLLTTPRDVVKIANALRVIYPPIRDEVSFVDFVGLEVLRFLEPPVYEAIRDYGSMFRTSENTEMSGTIWGSPSNKEFHKWWMDRIDDPRRRLAIADLVMIMFPATNRDIERKNLFDGPSSHTIVTGERGVSHGPLHDLYFKHVLGASAFSNSELNKIIELAPDRAALREHLVELHRIPVTRYESRADRLLGEIEGMADRFDATLAAQAILALVDAGDPLAELDEEFDRRPAVVRAPIAALLDRLDTEQRFEVLQEAVEHSPSLFTVLRLINWLVQAHGFEVNSRLRNEQARAHRLAPVDFAAAVTLQELAIQRLQRAYDEDTLWSVVNAPVLVMRWAGWCGADVVRPLMDDKLDRDDVATVLLRVAIELGGDDVDVPGTAVRLRLLRAYVTNVAPLVEKLRTMTFNDVHLNAPLVGFLERVDDGTVDLDPAAEPA